MIIIPAVENGKGCLLQGTGYEANACILFIFGSATSSNEVRANDKIFKKLERP